MSKVSDRIASLENLIQEREIKLNKKIKNSVIIYIVLVICVGIYTTVVGSKIKELTTIENMFEVARGTIAGHVTTLRNEGINKIKGNSDQWAATMVNQGIDVIPQLEKPILMVFDDLNDYVIQHVENVLVPAFTDAIRDNAADLKDRYNEFKDDEKMQGLSLIFVEIFENEMDKYINDKFISEVFDLQFKLNSLASSNLELTKREIAQRKIIINWLYLVDNTKAGDSPLSSFISRFANQAKSLINNDDNLSEEEQNKEEFDGLNLTQEL